MKKLLLKILFCSLLSCSILFCLIACNQTSNCQHSWQEVVLKEATCSEEGVLQNICTICGDNKSELLPKKAHSEEVIPAILEDCANSGLTEGKKCSVCDEIIVQQEIVSATGLHSYNQGNCIICQKVQCEGLIYTLINEGTAYEVTGLGSCEDSDLIIPSIYNNLPVISVGQSAFYWRTDLKSVTIPDSVITINKYAFDGCNNLKSVTISNNATMIGNSAFSECSALTNIVIPNNVTSIGEEAFYRCTSLTSVTLGNKVNSIGNSAFEWCYKLVEIYNLSTLNIKVGGKYSYGCISYYAKNVFSNLLEPSNLSTDKNGFIVFNYGQEKILMGYVGLENNLILPNDITRIYSYAFFSCDDLMNIEINEGVTYIGQEAFRSCSSLKSIIIPNSVESIGNSAFYSCYDLTNVTIGKNVTNIGPYPFRYCSSLKNIEVNVDNLYYKSINGNLYSKDGTKLIQYAVAKEESSFIVPDGVITIETQAFSYCDNLMNITIPNSVTTIGEDAFYSCSGLVSLTIGSNVNNIKYSAFRYCDNLSIIYYNGNVNNWNTITIGDGNLSIANAIIYFYSEEEPTLDGKHWHYVNGVPTIWPNMDN